MIGQSVRLIASCYAVSLASSRCIVFFTQGWGCVCENSWPAIIINITNDLLPCRHAEGFHSSARAFIIIIVFTRGRTEENFFSKTYTLSWGPLQLSLAGSGFLHVWMCSYKISIVATKQTAVLIYMLTSYLSLSPSQVQPGLVHFRMALFSSMLTALSLKHSSSKNSVSHRGHITLVVLL